jgi:epoxyqueuosine reductase
MDYLRRHFSTRFDPSLLVDGARSVIVAALSYYQKPPPQTGSEQNVRGRVAMYAWGDDYHRVVKDKLGAMVEQMRAGVPTRFDARVCVDTAPVVEREPAAAAGIGWIGKNTLVLNRRFGSYFVLGEIVTTLELEPDEPLRDRCGTCTACLNACPTGALTSPYEMDASRCISYSTIEHRGDIPEDLQAQMGNWVFGCDVCQEVCPYNRHAPVTREPRFAIRSPGPQPSLDEILAWTTDDYRAALRGSAMKRATLDMLKRNARIALNNAKCLGGGQ